MVHSLLGPWKDKNGPDIPLNYSGRVALVQSKKHAANKGKTAGGYQNYTQLRVKESERD